MLGFCQEAFVRPSILANKRYFGAFLGICGGDLARFLGIPLLKHQQVRDHPRPEQLVVLSTIPSIFEKQVTTSVNIAFKGFFSRKHYQLSIQKVKLNRRPMRLYGSVLGDSCNGSCHHGFQIIPIIKGGMVLQTTQTISFFCSKYSSIM